MRCSRCNFDYPEKDIEESHDVPKYLFWGLTNAEKKNQADKFPRHWLCKVCHSTYERKLREYLQKQAFSYSEGYFQ